MPNNPLKSFDDEILDVKKQSLYARLKRLFSSDVIVRNIGGKQIKVKDTDNVMLATDKNSLRDRFNRIRSTSYNSYSRDFALSYQAARMDLFRDYDTMDSDPIISCLSPTTYISTLKGFVTIKDLSEQYPNGESFEVWSWDNDEQKLTIGNAHHPRKTGTKKVIELHLDNDEIVKCTPDHRIMLIDGTYKEAGKLLPGDSLMPFYHRINKHHGYQEIKSLGKRYKYVHRYIFEDVMEQHVGNDNIHHKNHNKLDNTTKNLERLTAIDHCKLHGISQITNGNRSEKCKEAWKNPEYRSRCSTALKRWQMSDEGKQLMSENISIINKHRWNSDVKYATKMAIIFSNHAKSMWNDPEWKEWKRKKHSETMKLKHANDLTLRDRTKRIGISNGRYEAVITTESILVEGTKYESLLEFSKNFDFKGLEFKNDQYRCQFIHRRLNAAGYSGWKNYKENFQYSNHKVIKIIDNNETEDVYDLTVDIYENFAIKQGIIVSNSALDIFSDECLTYNEMGKMLTVHSNNNNVKQILENLFNDILNIQFNMWSWVRNMVKYGDFYLKLSITPNYGVCMVEPISAYNVERIENSDPYNKRYVKFQIRPTDTTQAEVLENYEMAHFRLISDSNFIPYGKCIKHDSYIDTEHGTKQIKNVSINDKIWSFNSTSRMFELKSIKNVWATGKKELLKIRTQHNFIECSNDHKVLTYNSEKDEFQYKPANNIKIKDLLVINNNKHRKFVDVPVIKIIIDDKEKTCPMFIPETDNIPDIVDLEFSEFFGFMIGDGWIRHYGNSYRICAALGIDEEQNKRYISLLEKYAGKSCNISYHNGQSKTAVIYSKRLYTILKNMGFGNDAKSKRIPEWVFSLSSECQIAFITGFGNADGWQFQDKWANRYEIELCNKNLILDFKRLLQLNNIKSGIPSGKIYNDKVKICGVLCNRSESWHIHYYLDAEEKTQQQKYNFLNTDEFILDPVRSIEDGGEDECWDIEVDSDDHNFIANGIVVHNSMIEGGRRVWKQLSLMEDAMLIHRIMRAPEKRIFYTDIGNIPPAEVDNYMQKMMDKMKKVPYMDEQSGEYNLRFNLQNMVEDYYIPVRGGDSGTKIDTLGGMEWTGTEDVEYLRNKLMSALKIPKAFLGYEEGISGKSTLAAEDVRFARTIQRIQRIICSELTKIAIIHLYSQGYRDESLVDFELELTNPSTIFEKEKLEILSEKINVATDMVENKFFSYNWIYKNIFNMSDDDAETVRLEIVEDAKQRYRFTSIEEDGHDPAKPFSKIGKGDSDGGGDGMSGGGSGGGLGGGLGGGGGGLDGLGDDLAPDDENSGGEELPDPTKGPENVEGEPEQDATNQKKNSDEEDLVKEEKTIKDTRDRSDRYDHSPRPSQAGQHKYDVRKDDPLGGGSLKEKPNRNSEGKRKSQLSHNFENGSPLNLEENKKFKVENSDIIVSLSKFLSKSQKDTKKELINESQPTSMLDETNILTE